MKIGLWQATAALLVLCCGILKTGDIVEAGDAQRQLRIATFQADATPPIGSPLCFGFVPPAKEIVDPLSARGIVLLGAGEPIVLCAVDWVGIGNSGYDAWRTALAEAAGTVPNRVTIHVLHQHDAPGCDFDSSRVLAEAQIADKAFDDRFLREVIRKVAMAVRVSLAKAQPVSHVGIGVGTVAKVASNRRILGPDGKVKIVRYSSSTIPEAIAAPEGTIDAKVRLVSFWNNDQPLVSMTFYATHPQSYYGQGGVSADFVGLARALREEAQPGVFHLHFNGAAGNVAAGKYNNGQPALRPVLARRLYNGMKSAWDATVRFPISPQDVRWSFRTVSLPLRDFLYDENHLKATLHSPRLDTKTRIQAGMHLAYARCVNAGRTINVNCLSLKSARILFLPGELFVEYQLAAQQMRPRDFVAMAAYGDYGPEYIGTQISYSQGGYETGPASRTAPAVEGVLMRAERELLRD
jgi:hypothetical protein